jgi:diacylglycerol kinase (ATP)
MNNDPQKPEKIHGIAHLFAAARYSMGGARRLWGETAFRHQLLAGLCLVAILIWIGAELMHVVMSIVLVGMTIAIEALNTAIEEIVDLVSPEWSLPAKHAKDLGSFAVFAMLCLNGIFAVFVTLTTLNWI